MKTKLSLLMSLFMILMTFMPVYAEEDDVNIKQWNYQMLTGPSDQDEKIKVNMFYSMENRDKHAFCVEPDQSFRPKHAEYYKDNLDNDFIYKIVKAYETFGLQDTNYYIATQLLIWNELTGIEYTFDNYGYEEYKEELLNLIKDKKPLLKAAAKAETNYIESYLNEENTIEDDFSEYEANCEGLEVISNDEEGFVYKITEELPEVKTVEFSPKDKDEKHEIVLRSQDSQDIYYFDDEYSNLKPFSLSLLTLKRPTNISINYSKKDRDGINIKGAEFSVYDLNNSEPDDELIFIQNNEKIDIYEAILNDKNEYQNLRIETSERFVKYIDGDYIVTNEIGYFPYKIYSTDTLIKQGRCYVTNDISYTNGSFRKYATRAIFRGFSEDLDINTITNLPSNSTYFLCESEPKKGYTYESEPCVLVNGNDYNNETFNFINDTRRYTLKLVKQSPDYIPLDGAIFNLKYSEDGIAKDITFKTGSLLIPREDSNKYLIYKHESSNDIKVIEFDSDYFTLDDALEGKYYYYQSNSHIVNSSLLNDKFVNVVKGGFSIDNLPYSSSLTLEELVPPKGFMLDDDPVYHIDPDISYSEITFKNYRVNNIDIIPKKQFIIPKTCVN